MQAIRDRPILMFWDRVPWHHGAPIHVLAANPRSELIEFPVAAPEPNPQEHVWKATRRATGHTHVQPRLPELADRFEQHLVSTTFQSDFCDRYGYTAILPMSNQFDYQMAR